MTIRFAGRALVAILTLSVAGLGNAAAAGPAPSAKTVQIANFKFAPEVLHIPVGTKVTWVNTDGDPHVVVAVGKNFRSAALDINGKFAFTFTKPGDYAYFCSLHPFMKGRIIVGTR